MARLSGPTVAEQLQLRALVTARLWLRWGPQRPSPGGCQRCSGPVHRMGCGPKDRRRAAPASLLIRTCKACSWPKKSGSRASWLLDRSSSRSCVRRAQGRRQRREPVAAQAQLLDAPAALQHPAEPAYARLAHLHRASPSALLLQLRSLYRRAATFSQSRLLHTRSLDADRSSTCVRGG